MARVYGWTVGLTREDLICVPAMIVFGLSNASDPDETLGKLFCEVDREFFPEAFPDFRFHRGDSWDNTIAYGKDHCDFIFEKK